MSKQPTSTQVIESIAGDLARERCARNSVDPDVTLHVFRDIRSNPLYRRQYLLATRCQTGFERGMPDKQKVNTRLGAVIKAAIKAENAELKVPVPEGEEEFIETYTRFKPREPMPPPAGRTPR